MKETDLVYQLSKKCAEARTLANKFEAAIKAIQEVCEHEWKIKQVSYGHNGEETDYTCDRCGLERNS
jgi:hypothetical protein